MPALRDSDGPVEVVTADTNEPAPPTPTAPKKDTKLVRWLGVQKGLGTIRKIRPSDWATVGVNGRTEATWSLGNDFKLPAALFNSAELDYLLNAAGVTDKGGRFELIKG